MEDIGQLFRLGTWVVRPDNAQAFVAAWQASGDWLAKNLPNERGAVLLEDPEEPGRYVSFAPVSDPERVVELMSTTEFQDVWSEVMALCESVRASTLRVVGASRP